MRDKAKSPMPNETVTDIHAVRTAADQMAVCLAREVKDGNFVFHGVNSPLPMVAIFLAKKLHAPRCTLISVAGAVDPNPSRLPFSTSDPALCDGAAAMFSNPDTYDLFARGGIDLMFLGGAQIDKAGRVNMSYIGDPAAPKVRLPGGGGGAVIMPQVERTMIWRTVHDRRTFVPQVDFVTQAGSLRKVVTPIAVLAMQDSRIELESVHPGYSMEEVAERTGFLLDLTREVPETAPPSTEERAALEDLDPEGVRYSEFPAWRAERGATA
jgi:glutaconate CoA-transferase subunit B